MGALAWTMMGLALWHFTIFVPDKFWAGIVGAFLGSIFGALLFGLVVNGFAIPGRHSTDLGTVLEAVPGSLLGIGIVYLIGVRAEQRAAPAAPMLPGT